MSGRSSRKERERGRALKFRTAAWSERVALYLGDIWRADTDIPKSTYGLTVPDFDGEVQGMGVATLV